MRQPVNRAPHRDTGRSPAKSAVAADTGPVSVNAPLLATQQQQYNTAGLDAEHDYQQARLSDIKDVEVATREVQGLFQDFKLMTDAQQEGLDKAEEGVDKSTGHVQKGNEQLKQASETQKSTRKWQCCLLVFLAVAIAAVIIALYAAGKL